MRSFKFIFTVLLLYIIAALTFWWFSLERQSDVIAKADRELLKLRREIIGDPKAFENDYQAILKREKSREKQYIGEGLTFLLVTLAGAVIVYRSFKKTVQLSTQQNNFMLAVTHELKSPIAGIKLGLQTLQRHNLDDQHKQILLGKSINEANRLDDLCSNILITSQIEGRQYKMVREQLPLSVMLRAWASLFHDRLGTRLHANIADNIVVMGDRLLLQLAFSNILENAVKYGGQGDIWVQLAQTEGKAVLSIADEGNGIAEEERKKVFQKFYRIGAENTRKQKGTGLGLYLTEHIIKQHKGSIEIKDAHPHGAIFEVRLPYV